MKRPLPRLIATDLDGTLLDENGSLPDGTFEIIRALREKGIRFAACSGRQYPNLRRLFRAVADEISYVCENGSLCAAEGQVIVKRVIPRETADAIIRDVLSLGMELMVSGPTATCLFGTNRLFSDDIVYRLRNTCTIITSLDELPEEIIKISGYLENGIDPVMPGLIGKWGETVHANAGSWQWFDFTLGSKASGLEAVGKHFGVTPAEMAAFGDSFNDEPMLDLVGFPHIISTADPRMKKPRYTVFDSELGELRELLRTIG